MSIVANPRAGWAMSAASASAVGFWLVLGGPRHFGQDGVRPFVETAYTNIVFGLLFPLVGALILSRVPGHRLGWLYCLCGLASSLALASYSYAERGLVEQPGSLPGALAAAWLSSWIWICGFSPLLTFGILGFPDGRLPGRRWWPVAALAAPDDRAGSRLHRGAPGPLGEPPGPGQPPRRSAATVVAGLGRAGRLDHRPPARDHRKLRGAGGALPARVRRGAGTAPMVCARRRPAPGLVRDPGRFRGRVCRQPPRPGGASRCCRSRWGPPFCGIGSTTSAWACAVPSCTAGWSPRS